MQRTFRNTTDKPQALSFGVAGVLPPERYPLTDRPCGICGTPTTRHIVFALEGRTVRAPCCDGCSSELDDGARAKLLELVRAREAAT